jgi:hypothetical protein
MRLQAIRNGVARLAGSVGLMLCAVLPTAIPAPAQACDDYGGCWAVPSLEVSQSIIRDAISREIVDRQILDPSRNGDSGDTAPRDRATPQAVPQSRPVPTTADALAQLHFTPSLQERQRNFAAMVAAMRPRSPAGARELETLFARGDLIDKSARALAPVGISTDNLADAYALWWVTVWAKVHGATTYGDRAQVQAVRGQAARALAQTDWASSPDADKQELAESLIVEVMTIPPAFANSANDPARRQALTQNLRRSALTLGIDLDAMVLGPNGFVPADR